MRRATLTLALLALGCATRGAPPAAPPPAPLVYDVPHLEERALLLLLADRRMLEPFSIDRLLGGGPELRAELAVTLGRIGDPEAAPWLERLLVDAAPEVRRAAAFAFGQLPGVEPPPVLLRAVADADRETGTLAAVALARAGRELTEIVRDAAALPDDELERRLLPALWRLDDELAGQLAVAALGRRDELRRWAAYALARPSRPELTAALRGLLADPDPWIRGWAARALGREGDGGDLARLRPLLDDPEPGPAIRALQAAARLVAAGEVAAPPDWRPRLAELLSSGRSGVRLAAIEAAGAWLLDPRLGARLARLAESGPPAERQAALLALARGGDPRAADLVRLAAAGGVTARASAAEAAALLGDGELLERLLGDEASGVRLAALQGLLGTDDARAAVAAALADGDPVVRGAALEWLIENPVIAFSVVAAAARGLAPEQRAGAMAALAARARAAPAEEGPVVALLESSAETGPFLERRAAAAALAALGRPAPEVGAVETGREVADYARVLQRVWEAPDVELATPHGALRLRLDGRAAPLTVLSFLQLVGQGFYDGLSFHRVVADFVVQGGDPRGDGWGGPGYTLRDEINRTPFERGVVGMALSGPDTAGSQFFIVLSPQPHLEGRFTAFGRVVAGESVLERIERGDRIEAAREVPRELSRAAPAAPAPGR